MRKKYGTAYSMKVGSYKCVFAEDVDSVKEVLVKKSADYAGRPPFYSFLLTTMGMYNEHGSKVLCLCKIRPKIVARFM